jgi:putative transposase
VIESSFAIVCRRTDRTKGRLTRDGTLAMIYELGLCAERSWRRLRAFPKIVEGVKFHHGVEVQNVVRSH